MGDEGRLELDGAGDVVDRGGAPATLVDLADPDATERLVPTSLDSWVSTSAAPWVRAHRRAVVGATAGALVLALAAGWWSSRPAPPPRPPVLALEDAPVVGADLGGPRIDATGHLSVAFVARAAPAIAVVDIVGLHGPGLVPHGVEEGAESLPGGGRGFVQLVAQVACTDPGLATATPSSYGLTVRTPGSVGSPSGDALLAFDQSTTALDIAVRNACLASVLPARVSIASGEVSAARGSSLADLTLVVTSDADVPLTVATARTTDTAVETDLSTTVLLAPHGSAAVRTRLLVHDCAGPSRAPALTGLPGPQVDPASPPPAGQAGITVRVGLGAQWTLASYALPWTVRDLTERLATTVCAGHPTVSATLLDVRGARTADGGWTVTGGYDVRTTGVGITLGREHFEGPPVGAGSVLTTTDSLVPGVPWAVSPTRLDGGAGRLPVVFSGPSCDDRDAGVPTSMALWVATADRSVYPFELPLDPAGLRRAVDDACARAGEPDRGPGG